MSNDKVQPTARLRGPAAEPGGRAPAMHARVIAGLELALIVLPTTALALWGVFVVVSSTLTPEKAVFGSALAVALVATAGVWRLLVPILLGADRAAIAALRAWWLAVWMGGAYVVLGVSTGLIVSRLTELAESSRTVVGSATMVAFFGLPMLLPLIHLALLVPRRQRSNKHFDGTSARFSPTRSLSHD